MTKMTRKGQVTIPASIRKKLDLQEGSTFHIIERDGDIIFRNDEDWVERTAGSLSKYAVGKPPLTEEDIDNAWAEAAVERYLRSFDE